MFPKLENTGLKSWDLSDTWPEELERMFKRYCHSNIICVQDTLTCDRFEWGENGKKYAEEVLSLFSEKEKKNYKDFLSYSKKRLSKCKEL
jgi:hypothetical protein